MKMIKNSVESRVSVKLNCPNPLFEKWLEEWKNQAVEKQSKTQHAYALALKSLRKYPLPLETGRDCKILKGFGSKLCEMLDDALKEHNSGENSSRYKETDLLIGAESDTNKVKKRRSDGAKRSRKSSENKNEYIPMYRSGPYAVILALYKASLIGDYQGFMLKKDLIKAAQPFCDSSFTKAEPGSYYTAWNSVQMLINKNFVQKNSSPAKFSLTSEGNLIGCRIYNQISENMKDPSPPNAKNVKHSHCEDIIQSAVLSNVHNSASASSSREQQKNSVKENKKESSDFKDIILAPHSFDVILYVDTCETSGRIDPQDDAMLAALKHLKVNFEVKNLKVGDYCWICRDRVSKEELVTPYVIERKRMDDLASSIKDGRFYEQKFRLKQCGLQHLIYMVETFGTKDEHLGLPLSSIYQGTVNTLVQDGFVLKFVDGTKGVAEYLACMSNLIQRNYENKTLVSCPKDNISDISITDDLVSLMLFSEFNKLSTKAKSFTVKEMFIKLLLQIKGISIEKAMAIAEEYGTPQALMQAFNEHQTKTINSISNIKHGKLNKKIGPQLSNVIHQLFTKLTF